MNKEDTSWSLPVDSYGLVIVNVKVKMYVHLQIVLL